MKTSSSVRIAIAEDNSFALKVILDKLIDATITVGLTASNGFDLLTKIVQAGRIDLILMDIEMPGMDGIEATRKIKEKFPNIKVVMLTIFDDDDKILEAIMAGADGYVLKEERGPRIMQCIAETLDGGAGMSAGIAGKVLKMMKRGTTNSETESTNTEVLTKREGEVLDQLRAGFTYEKIAENLFISYGTVRKHVENVYRKLQVHNKVEAIQKRSK